MAELFDQKELLEAEVERLEAKNGGPSRYSEMVKKQIAGFDDEAAVDDPEFYSISIGTSESTSRNRGL